MPDRSPYRDMTDQEIERLVSSLPGVSPPTGLRSRLLEAAPRRAVTRARLLRPSWALVALALLVLADVAVLNRQALSPSAPMPSRSAQTAAAVLQYDPELGLGRRMIYIAAPSDSPSASQPSAPDSYLSLRRQIGAGA